ncbi:MAG TPA: S8 family serine peptidase [Verrucomicrobiae bacterium]|nr:S8 family serine peptidase [Verrucomicrobiae bacterium]
MKTLPVGVSISLLMFGLAVNGLSAGPNHSAQESVEGDVIVTFKPGVKLPAAKGALTGHSLAFQKYYSALSQHRGKETGLIRAKNRTTAQLIAELSRDPAVETAEPNYLRWVTSTLPNDPLFSSLWGLKNTGQPVDGTAGTAGDDIRFLAAWALAQPSGTNPPVVAVIDTGVDYTHPDLAGNMWTNAGELPGNGVDDDSDGLVDDYHGYDFADDLPDPADSGYHGTHVAGTIGATGNNQRGVIGVDYQARIMALRASSDGQSLPDSAIIDAIQYATLMKTRGVNIVAINESFGGGGFNSAERAAMQAAGDAGIIFCVAAGNETNNNDAAPTYPANYGLTNMIVVAATDQNDALAGFSNYGTNSVDVAAPGVNILSALPVAQAGTVTSVNQGATTYSANELTFSGTTTGITATVYDCGLGNPGEFPAAVQNNIALIQRGTLLFSEKVANAMAAGARAAIIYNNVSGNFFGTLGVTNNWIPAVSLSQADGLAMLTNAPATVVNAPDPAQIYQYLAGTSMATPHVAGAVAFAAQNFPAETVPQRIQRVLTNADVIPGLQSTVHNGRRLNLQRMVDTDTNGLPDWWELQYFGHLTGTGPNADPDQDGLGNLSEWLAGTNPTNAASGLRLFVSSAGNSNGVVLSWPSVAGRTYRLERATNLLTGFHSTVRTNVTATAPTNTETDAAILPGNARYYRVGVEP